jgi:hypothetical protein
MLRVYSAAHGLTSPQHAVVEVGADEIILRVEPRWARFTHDQMTTSEGATLPFSLAEDGTVTIGPDSDEMDMAAEGVARKLLLP